MDSKKTRGRNSGKIFKWFRPVASDNDLIVHDVVDGGVGGGGGGGVVFNEFGKPPVVRYVSVNGEKGKFMLCDDQKSVESSSSDAEVSGRGVRKSSSRRRISRVFKAVFSDTASTKKIRSSKSGKGLFRSNSCFSFRREKSVNAKANSSFNGKIFYDGESSDSDDVLSTSSRTISSTLSTSCSPSINSNSRSLSERKATSRTNSMERKLFSSPLPPLPPSNSPIETSKPRRKRRPCDQFYCSNIALCLIFISLFVLVLWGRIPSILCTSTWLILGPGRRVNNSHGINSSNPVNSVTTTEVVVAVDSPDMESEEYKKRVIIEGLLERNRTNKAR